jgi:hypothetical protein
MMALISINEEEEYTVHGDSKAGMSVRQGNNVIIIPPEVVEKIKASK